MIAPPRPLKIYYLPTVLAGPVDRWGVLFDRARDLGFNQICLSPLVASRDPGDLFLADDFDRADPRVGSGKTTPDLICEFSRLAANAGLALLLDVVLDRVDSQGAIAKAHPALFARSLTNGEVVDPRGQASEFHGALARFDDPQASAALLDQWAERLGQWREAGAEGFRLLGMDRVPAQFVANLADRVDDARMLAWMPGVDWSRAHQLEGARLDGVFGSTAWWDGRASWYFGEHDVLRHIAPIIATLEPPFGPRLAQRATSHEDRAALYRRALLLAAATSDGLMMPMGFESLSAQSMDSRFPVTLRSDDEVPLRDDIVAANELIDQWSERGAGCRMRPLSGPASIVTELELVERRVRVEINNDASAERRSLAPGEMRIVPLDRKPAVVEALRNRKQALKSATQAPRIVIENVSPSIDGGALPTKSIVNQPIAVEADIYMDGHDVLAAELLWRPADARDWRRTPLSTGLNDRWQAEFSPDRVGRWRIAIEAWLDEYATLCRALLLKHEAHTDIKTELAEMRQLLDQALAGQACSRTTLSRIYGPLERGDTDASVKALISADTRKLVRDAHKRRFVTQHPPLTIDVDRREAGFASWYEMFPRSAATDARRHGTFDDVVAHLPRVRDMGFDVLYFPPIHPVGRTARKGRNNTLSATAQDVGSVYAIGNDEGGHDAVNPALGTLDDFRRLIEMARRHELEIALDFAIQCSPDHPWLKEHPDWFSRRPDGTIKHAENPPKKYEDIVNVDFYADGAIPALWETLRNIVLFWIEQGVKIFRVDNPHTKPLPFWQWMIADVRSRHPDALFLSEAFTRPKMMYRLAKVGFSQSYTYFTWRNTKQELTEYLTELSSDPVARFFRPNFFVNTPDINPFFLQASGRPGFLIRAVLASTLSGLWGLYSGFELCEAAPLSGREEYLDSEKYEVRVRDFNAPGNIVSEITALNRLRRSHPALQTHLGVRFYSSSNEQVLVYGKALASHEDMVFVVVSLDPHHPQEASFEIPLWEWKLPDNGTLAAEDMMNGRRFALHGKRQWLRLDPAGQPFAIWRLAMEGAA